MHVCASKYISLQVCVKLQTIEHYLLHVQCVYVTVLQRANEEYSKKQQKQSGTVSDKCMFGLAWDVHELDELNSTERKLRVEIAVLSDKFKGDAASDWQKMLHWGLQLYEMIWQNLSNVLLVISVLQLLTALS